MSAQSRQADAQNNLAFVRKAYVRTMLAGVAAGGVAFVYKIAEFVQTLDDPEVAGFVVVPVTVYFAVAGGFACLIAWAWLTGQFEDLEQPKFEMLEKELEYERSEPQFRS